MGQLTPRRALRPSPAIDGWAINRRVFAAQLDPGAKIVLLVVLDHARHGQSTCTASNATIAREANLSVRQIGLHVKMLVEDGWLDLERLGPTVNHGRILHMGSLCLGLRTPAQPIADPPPKSTTIPLRNPSQTNVPLKDQGKDSPSVPPAPESGGPFGGGMTRLEWLASIGARPTPLPRHLNTPTPGTPGGS